MKPYYQDELVTLYHGDCLEINSWLAADVLVTDPPYGIQIAKLGDNAPAIVGELRTGRSSRRVLTDDHVAPRNAALAMWGAKPALVFGHWRAPRPADTRMRLIWDKGILGMGNFAAWRPSDEEIYLVGEWPNPKGGSASEASVIRNRTLRGNDRPDHPTPKPVALMEYLIGHVPPGVLADPFAGSGATLIAARNLGRRVIGVEIEERYCELMALRLGQQAFDLGGIA